MPLRNSSITTFAEALPNIPPSISLSSFFASSSVGNISTPLPAHSPSAFSTYGAFIVSRKASPSSMFVPLKVRYLAVGMLCLSMKLLAKSLLPSSTAPCFDGPITGTFAVRGSSRKLSYMPFTSGSSGPTTTMSMPFSATKSFSLSKSSALMATFSPASAVPALPGAMYSFSTLSLCAIFHASACSRPPLPNNNIFIL